jgi:hypothetical protein
MILGGKTESVKSYKKARETGLFCFFNVTLLIFRKALLFRETRHNWRNYIQLTVITP